MSSDAPLVSDGLFRAGVLTALGAGLALAGYTTFFRKQTYLVEFRASTTDSDEPPVKGNYIYTGRPFEKDNEHVVACIARHVRDNSDVFQKHDPADVTIEITGFQLLE